MPSSRELIVIAALGLAAAACGDDRERACETSYLRYDNFGQPFIANWCRGCHSSELEPGMRQLAPNNINFDTLDDVHAWADRISITAGHGTSMPPAGGPSSDERTMLDEWLGCGAPP
jgi:uncharacterized membrane protein